MKKNRFVFSMLILMMFLSCEMGGSSSNGGGGGDDNTLEKLGVETELGAREDVNENSLTEDYNPFSFKVGTLFKKCEVYVSGMGVGSYANGLFQDGSESYSLIYNEPEDNWADGQPKKAIEADVDGDGLDEIVNVIYYWENGNRIVIRVLDYNNGTDPEGSIARTIDTDIDLENALTGTAGGTDSWEDAFFRQDLAAADLDGDGKCELIIAVELQILILDDEDNNFATIAGFEVDNLIESTDTYVRIDTADYDFDGKHEIVYINGEDDGSTTAQYTILDDIVSSPNQTAVLSEGHVISGGSGTYKIRAGNVTTGDFDGDGLMETAFAGMREDNSDFVTLILDTTMNSSSELVFTMLETYNIDENTMGYLIPPMDSGDLDGDRKDEIAMDEDILSLTAGSLDFFTVNDALSGNSSNDNYEPYIDILRMGDVTGDRKADIVYATRDEEGVRIRYWDGAELQFSYIDVSSAPDRPTLCLPNVDQDSAVLEYLDHDLQFSDPIVIALLASPPYWAGINDDGDGGTDFGWISGQSETHGSDNSLSVGISIGAEFEEPFGTSGASLKTTVENSFNWGVSETCDVTETWGYKCGVGENKVVFTAIPFDVYYYEVLSSPETDEIGSQICISVPREPGTYHMNVAQYNSNNGDSFDIDETLLQHTLGDPRSYATETEKESLIGSGNGLYSENSLNVGFSDTGTSKITLTETETDSRSQEYSLSVTVEAEVKASFMTVGGSASYGHGFSYENSVTTGTYFEGEVPDIPGDFDSELLYNWGIMAYPTTYQGQRFTIATYWIE